MDLRNAFIEESENNYVIRKDNTIKCLLWIGFTRRGLGYNATRSLREIEDRYHYINNYDIPEDCKEYAHLV